jgi:tetratricopeptide (TPR) repeat protein
MYIMRSLFVVILFLSGCSSTPDNKENNEDGDVRSLAQKIIDLVQLPTTPSKDGVDDESQNNNTKVMASTKNAYLEQESKLMSGVSNDVIKTYQQAIALMEQKKWQEAITLFDQVIAKQSNLSGSYVNKALILKKLSDENKDQRTEQLKESELLVDKAISINPLNPYAQYFKGQLLQNRGEFEQAEKSYALALSIWPNYTQAQLGMAILLELYRGKLLESYQYYSAYLQLESEDKQVKRWQAALAIKIKRAGLSLPVKQGE